VNLLLSYFFNTDFDLTTFENELNNVQLADAETGEEASCEYLPEL
jgi:hypothetical protein